MSACPVCRRYVGRGIVPGPEWGLTHRHCFARVDEISEALERQFGGAVFDPDSLEVGHQRKLRRPNKGFVERVRARLAARGIYVEAA